MDDDKTLQAEVEETTAVAQVDADTTKTEPAKEPAEKLIPQSELDRIIGERIARERKKFEEEKANDPDRKFVQDVAKRYGKNSDEYRAAIYQQFAIADAEEEAKSKGVSAEVLVKQRELERELSEIKQREAEEKRKAAENAKQAEIFAEQAKEFAEKFPTVPIEKALGDAEFIEYAKDFAPSVPVAKRYERYLREKQLSELAKKHGEDLNAARSTASGRTTSDAQEYGLSAHQLELAKQAGMTPKQYHDTLPKRRK